MHELDVNSNSSPNTRANNPTPISDLWPLNNIRALSNIDAHVVNTSPTISKNKNPKISITHTFLTQNRSFLQVSSVS